MLQCTYLSIYIYLITMMIICDLVNDDDDHDRCC